MKGQEWSAVSPPQRVSLLGPRIAQDVFMGKTLTFLVCGGVRQFRKTGGATEEYLKNLVK